MIENHETGTAPAEDFTPAQRDEAIEACALKALGILDLLVSGNGCSTPQARDATHAACDYLEGIIRDAREIRSDPESKICECTT